MNVLLTLPRLEQEHIDELNEADKALEQSNRAKLVRHTFSSVKAVQLQGPLRQLVIPLNHSRQSRYPAFIAALATAVEVDYGAQEFMEPSLAFDTAVAAAEEDQPHDEDESDDDNTPLTELFPKVGAVIATVSVAMAVQGCSVITAHQQHMDGLLFLKLQFAEDAKTSKLGLGSGQSPRYVVNQTGTWPNARNVLLSGDGVLVGGGGESMRHGAALFDELCLVMFLCFVTRIMRRTHGEQPPWNLQIPGGCYPPLFGVEICKFYSAENQLIVLYMPKSDDLRQGILDLVGLMVATLVLLVVFVIMRLLLWCSR